MSIQNLDETVKIAIALKSARAALGINQVDFAAKLGIAKTTLARIETLEMPIKLDTYFKSIKILSEMGIDIDVASSQNISIQISPTAQSHLVDQLSDQSKRRSDRKK